MKVEVGTKLLCSCLIKESESKQEATLLLGLISLEALPSVHSFLAPFQT